MKAAVVMAAWLAAVVYWATRKDRVLLDEALASSEWETWVAAGKVSEFRVHPSNPAWRPRSLN
jgi:hypothetical protein